MTQYAVKIGGQETEVDTLYEHRIPGDPSIAPTGYVWGDGKDASEMFVPLHYGSENPIETGLVSAGKDFSKLFARVGSVSRFLQPLPWDRSVERVPSAQIYRQPSRNLITYVNVITKVNQHGRVEIKVRTPAVNSNPSSYTDTVVYELTSPPAWDESFAPAGIPFEIRFDVVAGDGITLGGLNFGQWYAMDSSRPEAISTASVAYNHATTKEGRFAHNSQLRISVRRSDYPDTNKADAVLTTALRLDVIESLFTNPADTWVTNLAVSDTQGVHDPDRQSQTRLAELQYTFQHNGEFVLQRRDTASGWQESYRSRWRRNGSDFDVNDFEVHIVTSSTGPGMSVTNPAASWKAIDANGVVLHCKQNISNHELPGSYDGNFNVVVNIRQKSTRNYSQNGVVLADNFAAGTNNHKMKIILADPPKFPWPNPAGWAGAYSQERQVKRVPESNDLISQTHTLTLKANGDFTINGNNGPIKTGRWCPAGVTPAEIEVRATHQVPSGHTGGNAFPQWGRMNVDRAIWVTVQRDQHSEGTTKATMTGNILMRRATFHKDEYSATVSLVPIITALQPVPPTWPGFNPGALHARKTMTLGVDGQSATAKLRLNFNGPGNIFSAIEESQIDSRPPVSRNVYQSQFFPAGANPAHYEYKLAYSGGPVQGASPTAWFPCDQSHEWTIAITRAGAAGSDTTRSDFTLWVRRKAYHGHQANFSFTGQATATINPNPHTLQPAADYTRWAGSWNHNFTNTY